MNVFDLVIKNGMVATASDVYDADVGIKVSPSCLKQVSAERLDRDQAVISSV
ncbi:MULTISPECIES: hypothetical protein [Rhizobium]|uniref:Uncharacterized protein n=1 Tax=Rhizobium tropici TaxID=398 RepID=A0A6P1CBJ1_RHITR|nr:MULTISPECIES: hypothetical protein [Rhizobium]MBB4244516.1 hypothetical protein [Rhizobium tropici]MBB5595718.1 hypothetical protein [Rhizobium tropici]MBB6494856.1 hypothetical protein [Rhizobium tropici]NEV12905.1 hypothetical protein [Rhizobium tropici]